MDFLDPDKKRKHIIRLFIGYILVAVAIAMGALILLFQSYGYDVDRRTGQIIQNGLLFVSARPDAASIYLNGNLNKSKTDTRLTIPAGQYSLELVSAGYRTWKRSFSLEGGSIERLVYPLLFPEKLVTSDLQLYATTPNFATSSADNHWLLVQQPGTLTNFDNFDLNNPKQPPTTVNLPADLLTNAAGDHKLTLVEWSDDNRHLLVKHTFAGGNEFVVIDRESPASSYNVNKTAGVNPSDVSLRDQHYDQLIIHDKQTGALQSYDFKTKQLTLVLQKVINYKAHGPNMILYSTEENPASGLVVVKLWDGAASYTVHIFAKGTETVLDMTQYSGNWYMVVGSRQDGHIYIYKNPQDSLKQTKPKPLVPITILKIDQAAFVSFSKNEQFIVAQNGPKFAVYDIETDRRYYHELKQTVPADQEAEWMDGYRLMLALDGKTVVFDYDGTNAQTLSANAAGLSPVFSRDYSGLYNIAPSVVVPSRAALTRTEMRVPR